MEQASVVQSTLVSLPVEVLVHIFSFLSTRDKVRIRCISKTLRSVGEVPSLWEDFIWSRYAPRDEKLLKHILKTFGKHIKRIQFDDHIAPSKLEMMVKFCKNVIHLSLPSFHYNNFQKLEKIVHSMGSIQISSILVSVFINQSAYSIRQYFTLSNNLKELSFHYRLTTGYCATAIRQWLEEWGNVNYTPRKLNIIVDRKHLVLRIFISSLQSCVSILRNKTLQKTSDSEDTAWVNIYLKTSTDISAAIPFVQLRVTDSSVVLSSVKASKYGILGLDDDTLHLTEGSYRGKKVHKALLTGINNEYMDTSVTSLTSVTHFDASCGGLYPGHLEQLSIACPNLQRLDLWGNSDCLNNLEGLHSLANNCKSLRGLCLKEIHVHDCEYDCIQLWEILCVMRLSQLAIETCMINICDSRNAKSEASAAGDCSARVKRQKLIHMFQRYSSLQVLEVGMQSPLSCYNTGDNELLLLTYFPSITYYRLCNLPSNNCHHTLKQIFAQKYLRCLFLTKIISGKLSLSLEGHCSSLQQLYIGSIDTVPTEAFIDALCGHGGLEHVILCFQSLTAKSIENMIEHSSNLVTFRVYLFSRASLKSQLKQLTTNIKKKFSKRRLFNGGNFDIKVSYRSSRVEVNNDTDLSSVWDSFVQDWLITML